uniref:PGG domain-containing protein n=1 Tax=Oryza brachyantha TaxID=4533 RepID=J3MDE2_ORYBR
MASEQSSSVKSKYIANEGTPLEYELRKCLLLLAIEVATMTYTAGFNPPGGVWQDTEAGHLAGDSIIRDTHYHRYLVFFYCNAAAFALSIVVIILIFTLAILHEWMPPIRTSVFPLRVAMGLDLIGLVGAYAAGTNRDVLKARNVCIRFCLYVGTGCAYFIAREIKKEHRCSKEDDILKRAQSLVVLLSTLVSTVTYQAGLVPPGGVWEENWNGHEAGDPVLLSMQPERYKVFFYCSSIAFAMSLVIIILVQHKPMLKHEILQFIMILDMFGLIGAYSAGSCRDVTTSIYVIALAGAVLVYVVIHVLFFTLEDEDTWRKDGGNNNKDGGDMDSSKNNEVLYKRRKRLASGGVWQGNRNGHAAGNPVMHDNGRLRDLIFFYSNSVSFVASIVVISMHVVTRETGKRALVVKGDEHNDCVQHAEPPASLYGWCQNEVHYLVLQFTRFGQKIENLIKRA